MDTSSDDQQHEALGFPIQPLEGVDAAETDPPRPQRSRGRVMRGKTPLPVLACPFYKLDPTQFRDCRHFVLRRAKDIKQHISRKHRSPEFCCDRCFTIFSTSEARAKHLRGQSLCGVKDRAPLRWISDVQIQKLGKNINRGKSIVEQWYDIWDIVFPCEPRPKSIYLSNGLEDRMRRVRNIWATQKANILPQAYQDDQVVEGAFEAVLRFTAAEMMSDAGCDDSEFGSTDLNAAAAEGGGGYGTGTGIQTTFGLPRPFLEPASSVNRDSVSAGDISGESGASGAAWLTSPGLLDLPVSPDPMWRETGLEVETFFIDPTTLFWVDHTSQREPTVGTPNLSPNTRTDTTPGPVAHRVDLPDGI